MNNKLDYSYQPRLIGQAFDLLMSKEKVVLAAAPSAGKTRMAINIANKYAKKFPDAKILVLAHGQMILRDQWDANFRRIDHDITFDIVESGEDYDKIKKNQALVGIPQTLQRDLNQKIDLLVVDEAHHYYFGLMVQGIINKVKPKHQLLLTGTPSIYLDNPEFSVIGITVQELLDHGVVTDPLIELVEAQYAITMRDYNEKMDLKFGAKINKSGTSKTLDSVLSKIVARLTSEHRDNPNEFNWDESKVNWGSALTALKKTMIVCHSQAQARDVKDYFESHGVQASLSISDMSEGSDELERFKTDPNCNLFVVVNRGILGFDFDQLSNLIDLSGSLNVNKLFQMLCRVIRRNLSDPDHKKLFVKVAPTDLAHVTHFVMSFVVALSSPDYYFTFKENVRADQKVPVPGGFKESLDEFRKTNPGDRIFPFLPKLHTFNDIRNLANGVDVKTIAYTNLRTVRAKISGNRTFYDENTCRSLLSRCKSLKEFRRKHRSAYEWLRINKLHHVMYEFFPKKEDYKVEDILALAKNFKTKSEFREAHHGAFKFLKKNGKLDLLPFEEKLKRWTPKRALAAAKKYKSRRQFMKGHGGAWQYIQRKGLIDELNKILPSQKSEAWTLHQSLEAAKRFKTRREFIKKHSSAWRKIVKEGAMDRFDKILPRKRAAATRKI